MALTGWKHWNEAVVRKVVDTKKSAVAAQNRRTEATPSDPSVTSRVGRVSEERSGGESQRAGVNSKLLHFTELPLDSDQRPPQPSRVSMEKEEQKEDSSKQQEDSLKQKEDKPKRTGWLH